MTGRYAVGLMSGTSCDGIDAACCRIGGCATDDHPFGYGIEVEAFVERAYRSDLRERLLAVYEDDAGPEELCTLRSALGEAFAKAAQEAIDAAGNPPVSVVGSHGHTVWHQPEAIRLPGTDAASRATFQIGDPSRIARRSGVDTVADFRSADVAVGGHGAPLAPYLDGTLFAADEGVQVAQNVGGIGNCTHVPPDAGRDDLLAFDTGPGNMVIDAVVDLRTDGKRTYDRDGELAAAGTPDPELVSAFLDDPYFERPPPKTTGREQFGYDYARRFVERGSHLSTSDLVASATALTARSIAEAYERFLDPYPDEVVVSGGGAHNPALLSMLEDRLRCPLRAVGEHGIEPDAKEAALMALLATAAVDGVAGNVPTATGADDPVVLGSISTP